jgi:hypothetical protein
MTRRLAPAVVLSLVALAAACGGGETGRPAASTTPVGDLGDAVEVAAGAPAAAGGAACEATRQVLETATEAYVLLESAPPANQAALVEAGLVAELSPWFEVRADGSVVAAPGSPCP